MWKTRIMQTTIEILRVICELIGALWLFALACFLLSLILDGLILRRLEWRQCHRCADLFETRDDVWLCPACQRAHEIFARDMEWIDRSAQCPEASNRN